MEIPQRAKDYADKFKNAGGIVDFYRFLGVPNTATDEEITQAMMLRASTFDADSPLDEYMKITMLSIAQKHLNDPKSRAAYDLTLSRSCSGNIYKNAAIDILLFFLVPAISYSILEAGGAFDGHSYSHSSIFTALMIALASCGLAYFVAFVTLGGYAALNLRQRFDIMRPIFLFTSTYWIILETANIADGYGEGNVMSLLFGLSVAGVIAWRRVAAANASPVGRNKTTQA